MLIAVFKEHINWLIILIHFKDMLFHIWFKDYYNGITEIKCHATRNITKLHTSIVCIRCSFNLDYLKNYIEPSLVYLFCGCMFPWAFLLCTNV